jgi:hypothetical protein
MKRFKILCGMVIMLSLFTFLSAQRSTKSDKRDRETQKEQVSKSDQAQDKDGKDFSLGSILEKITDSISSGSRQNKTDKPAQNHSSQARQSNQDKPSQKEESTYSGTSNRQNRSSSSSQSYSDKEDKPVQDSYKERVNSNRYDPSQYYRDDSYRSQPDNSYKPVSGQTPSTGYGKPNQTNRTQTYQKEQNSRSQFIYEKPAAVKETRSQQSEFVGKPQTSQAQLQHQTEGKTNPPSSGKPHQSALRQAQPGFNPPPGDHGGGGQPPNGEGGDSDHHDGNHDDHHDGNHDDHHNGHDGHHDYHNGSSWHFYFDFGYHPYYAWSDNYYYWDDWNYSYYDGWNSYYYWNGYYPPYPYYDYYHHRHYRYVEPVFYYSFPWHSDVEEFQGYLVRKTPHSGRHDNQGWLNDNNEDEDYDSGHNVVYCNIRGYGIVAREPDGSKGFYHFDRTGNRLAKNLWTQYGKRNRKVYVQISGILNPDTHTIKVFSMRRISRYHSSSLAMSIRFDWFHRRPHHWY